MEIIGNYCITSGKECFDTKGDAQKAMHRLDKKGAKKGAVYFCPDCNKWHITHYGYSKSKNIRQTKIKNNMAGTGKFKIGSELKFKDNLGSPLKCGDFVRNTITGAEGVITQYGVVKSNNGNYKLCDNIWEVIENVAEKMQTAKERVVEGVKEENKLLAEAREIAKVAREAEETIKTLESFSDDELLDEVLKRNFSVRTLAEHGISTYGVPEAEDQTLADELRGRGYEVTAEKTVKVSL